MTQSFGRKALLSALAATTLLISGCATETRYRPATGHGFDRTGYSERRIEPNHYLINFAGNSDTSRDTVERYLFYRAAELTVQNGYDYFITVDRNTDRQSRSYVVPGFGGPGYYGLGYWGPSWRYYGRFGGRGPGWGPWGAWGAWGGGFDNFDVRTVDRFEATAEVVMRKGPKPRDNVRAFDARKVIEVVGPSVRLPDQRR